MKDWLNNGLPVFKGEKDKHQARSMIDRLGGPEGFKTSYQTNLDGSITRLQLKGGMPPQVFRTSTVQSSSYIRGYISNIRSEALRLAGKRVSFLLKRIESLWTRAEDAPTFGSYIVSVTSSSNPDLWAMVSGVLHIFTGRSVKKRPGLAVSGIPLVVSPDSLRPYADGWGAFVLDDSSIFYGAGDSSSPAQQTYDNSELSLGTEGFMGKSSVAGVSYQVTPAVAAFNQAHTSISGSVLQRSRRMVLSAYSPYAVKDEWIETLLQGFVYIYPSGTLDTNVSDGVWYNPAPALDQACCDMYATTGTLGDMYGTYAKVGKLIGIMTDDAATCSTTVTTFNGSDGYTNEIVVGNFPSPVTATISVSVKQDIFYTDGRGQRRPALPIDIPYWGYGSATLPPIYSHKWMFYDDWSIATQPVAPAGTLYGPWVDGVSTRKDWKSVSTSTATLNGVLLGFLSLHISGNEFTWSGTRALGSTDFPYDGLACGLATPNHNDNASAWNAVILCRDAEKTLVQDSASERTDTYAFKAETRDYILYDMVNGTYVWVEGVFSGAPGNSQVELYVAVSYKGREYKKLIYSIGGDGVRFPTEKGPMGDPFHIPASMFVGFAPPFCCQGAFPYGAYSEDVESEDSVVLLSLPLSMQLRDTDDMVQNAYNFTPTLFSGVLHSYIGLGTILAVESDLRGVVSQINFADGTFTDWVAGAYTDAALDVTTFSEIYRT